MLSDWITNAFNVPVHQFVSVNMTAEQFVIHIKKGLTPPYYYKDGEGFNSKGVYIRNGSSKRRATDDEIRRMIKSQVAHEFDIQTPIE